MSQVRSDVDLSSLARPEAPLDPPRRSKLRILVPALLLLGFGGVLASTLTDLFRPVHDVTVVRPTRPNADQAAAIGAGQVAVQASGWIEPDPFPLHVPALADGVVEELHVQESDVVEAGQLHIFVGGGQPGYYAGTVSTIVTIIGQSPLLQCHQ